MIKLDAFIEEMNNRYENISENKLKIYYEENVKSHNELREILGGTEKNFVLNIPENSNHSCISAEHRDDFEYVVDEITGYVPDYLDHYKLDRSIFIQDKVGKIKLNKHVLTFFNKIQEHDLGDKESIQYDREYLKEQLSYLANLKNKKIKQKIKGEFEVKLCCGPIDFLDLGHYEVDDDSCFNDYRSNFHNKFSLGTTKNSFVLLGYLNKNIALRAWGIYNVNYMNFSNFYSKDKISGVDYINIANALSQNILKCKNLHIEIYLDFDSSCIHTNGDGIRITKKGQIERDTRIDSKGNSKIGDLIRGYIDETFI